MSETERTLMAYRHDPIIPSDPMLADRILAQQQVRRPGIVRWTLELRFSEAAIALSVLINLAAMVYVLGLSGRHDTGHDALAQLRAEYDIETVDTN